MPPPAIKSVRAPSRGGDCIWTALADPESEAGELLPIAFNNLGLEFEFADEREQAQQAYEYAITLAMRRWGENDRRTTAIKNAAWQVDQAVALGQFRVRKQVSVPRCVCPSLVGQFMSARSS